MTGDGVNDAPALKAADIGCAMGNDIMEHPPKPKNEGMLAGGQTLAFMVLALSQTVHCFNVCLVLFTPLSTT